MELKEIVHKRYATKKFDGEKIPEEKLDALLEIARFAASSYGLQPYRIKVIGDAETKAKLAPASYNQPQITSCSHLFVFCADDRIIERIERYGELMKEQGLPQESIEGYTKIMKGDLGSRSKEAVIDWAKRQCYLALGNLINGAKSLGFDSCPMEGFSPDEYKKILGLPPYLHPVVIATAGYAADEPRPKIRYPRDEVFLE